MAYTRHVANCPFVLLVGLALLVTVYLTARSSHANTTPEHRIIVDTDLLRNSDDHMAFKMLAELHNEGRLAISGVTLVAGNRPIVFSENDSLGIVEELGLKDIVPIHSGAARPLLHDPKYFHIEKDLYGARFSSRWLQDKSLHPSRPSYGLSEQVAANFIVETVRRNPGKVAIVALGPLTNLALAFRIAPEIVEDIHSIVYLGGAIRVPGNTTRTAEFNWWFDPEAASIVLSLPVNHVVIPLDVANEVLLDNGRFHSWSQNFSGNWYFEKYIRPQYQEKFAQNPDYSIPVWDTLVAAYLFDQEVAKSTEQLWINVDRRWGETYGSVTWCEEKDANRCDHSRSAGFARVVTAFDQDRFWRIFELLMFTSK